MSEIAKPKDSQGAMSYFKRHLKEWEADAPRRADEAIADRVNWGKHNFGQTDELSSALREIVNFLKSDAPKAEVSDYAARLFEHNMPKNYR